MRLRELAVIGFAFASTASAQYFSEGWRPGQAVEKAQTGYVYQDNTPTAASRPGEQQTPASSRSLTSLFKLESILESAPLQALFGRAGVNITEKLEAARVQQNIWDERIPLITDHNYGDLIVEEKFETLEEEKDRIWFIIISLSAVQKEGIHKYVDEQFDLAFNLTQEAGDLRHVRWGRIDYMNVTRITTKWNVWRAPFLVVLKDRGQTLRFYRPGQLRIQGEILREFLKRDAWDQTPPWRSAFGPEGNREFVMDAFAEGMTRVYDVAVRIPRWLLLVISGSLASFVINLLHNSKWLWGSNTPPPQRQHAAPQTVASGETKPPLATSESQAKASRSKGGAGKRRGGKK